MSFTSFRGADISPGGGRISACRHAPGFILSLHRYLTDLRSIPCEAVSDRYCTGAAYSLVKVHAREDDPNKSVHPLTRGTEQPPGCQPPPQRGTNHMPPPGVVILPPTGAACQALWVIVYNLFTIQTYVLFAYYPPFWWAVIKGHKYFYAF